MRDGSSEVRSDNRDDTNPSNPYPDGDFFMGGPAQGRPATGADRFFSALMIVIALSPIGILIAQCGRIIP